MNRKQRIIFIISIVTAFLTSILLIGCGQPEKVIVTKNVYRYEYIPDELLVDDIKTPRPPSKKAYVAMNPLEREKTLIIYISNLYRTIAKYKNKIQIIKSYNNKLKKEHK